jgi:very-short-patch-repair endonuclease
LRADEIKIVEGMYVEQFVRPGRAISSPYISLIAGAAEREAVILLTRTPLFQKSERPPFDRRGDQGGFEKPTIPMTRIYNRASDKEKRRELRKNMTRAEVLLWIQLKNRELLGQRVLRQYGIGSYVVDFYIPKFKLAIEIDGPSHLEEGAGKYDAMRQSYIEALGVRFLRFKNDEVYGDLNGVLQTIGAKIKDLTTPESPP